MSEDYSHMYGHSCKHGSRSQFIANLYCPQCNKFKCAFCEDDHLMVNTATLFKWIVAKNKLQKQASLFENKKKCLEDIDKYYNDLKDALTREYNQAKSSLEQMGNAPKDSLDEAELINRGIPKESIADLIGQDIKPINSVAKADPVKQYLDKISKATQKFDEINLLEIQTI